MSKMKRGLSAMVASTPLLLAIASGPAFGQADASDRPFRPVTAAMMSNPPASDWLQYRRTFDGHGFSPLAKITKANVGKLVPIWEFSTGLTKGHEVVPIERRSARDLCLVQRVLRVGCAQRQIPLEV
jgi:alcohol dehydrogenase (cytochrome c)